MSTGVKRKRPEDAPEMLYGISSTTTTLESLNNSVESEEIIQITTNDPPILGKYGNIIETIHNSKVPVFVQGKYYSPGTVFRVHEWADISLSEIFHYGGRRTRKFEEGSKSTNVYRIHRDGSRIQRLIGTLDSDHHWLDSIGGVYCENKNVVPTHYFSINNTTYYAAMIIQYSFSGPPPNEKMLGLHVLRSEESKTPDDSFQNTYWGSHIDNYLDAANDGMYKQKNGTKFKIWGRKFNSNLNDANFIDKNGNTIDGISQRGEDGYMWIQFASISDASELTGGSITAISQHLISTKGCKSVYGWTFQYVEVLRPLDQDMKLLDKSRRGSRFITRDARLLVEKISNGMPVIVELIIKPGNRNGRIQINSNNKEMVLDGTWIPSPISGLTYRARIVAWLFMQDEIKKKIAENPGLTFADLHVDHIIPKPVTNDCVSNLQILTREEHMFKTHAKSVNEHVNGYSGDIIGSWTSIGNAAKETGISDVSIGNSCRRNTGVCKRGTTIKRYFQFSK